MYASGISVRCTLPPELLCMVFLLFKADLISLLAISRVCRAWRFMSIGLPELWTRIVWNGSVNSGEGSSPDRIKAYLARSQRALLDVDIICGPGYAGEHDISDDGMMRFKDIVMPALTLHSSRWRSIVVSVGNPVIITFALVRCGSVTDADQLVSARLRYRPQINNLNYRVLTAPFGGYFPNLKIFEIDGVQINYKDLLTRTGLGSGSLTELSLKHSRSLEAPTWYQLSQTLLFNAGLTYLCLEGIAPTLPPDLWPTACVFRFPNMLHFVYSEDKPACAEALIRRMEMPVLVMLEITFSPDRDFEAALAALANNSMLRALKSLIIGAIGRNQGALEPVFIKSDQIEELVFLSHMGPAPLRLLIASSSGRTLLPRLKFLWTYVDGHEQLVVQLARTREKAGVGLGTLRAFVRRDVEKMEALLKATIPSFVCDEKAALVDGQSLSGAPYNSDLQSPRKRRRLLVGKSK